MTSRLLADISCAKRCLRDVSVDRYENVTNIVEISSPIFFFFHQFKIQIFSSLSAIRNEFINIRKKRRSIESLRIIIRVKINRAPLCPFCVASSGTRTNSRVQLERNAYITIPYITFRFYKFISLPQPYPENQSSNFLIVSNLSR